MDYYRKKFAAFPVYEWLETGLLLCLAGGFLDAYTFVTRGGVFANAQTGNLIFMVIGLASGEGLEALNYLIPVLLFFAGVFLSELCLLLSRRRREEFRGHSFVLLGEIAVLVTVGFLPADTPDILVNALVSLAAAVQFDNFRKMEGKAFATAFCTGNLRSATEHVVHAVADRDRSAIRVAGKYLLVIVGFLAGVLAGYFASIALGNYAVLVAAGVLLLVFCGILADHALRRRRIRMRRLTEEELPAAKELMLASFDRFIAPAFTPEGVERFRRFLYDADAPRFDAFGIFAGGMLQGALLATADGRHICAFFTRNGEQGRGYGGKLMRWFLANTPAKSVTVYAAPRSIPVYQRLGFVKDGKWLVRDGMTFLPMRTGDISDRTNIDIKEIIL